MMGSRIIKVLLVMGLQLLCVAGLVAQKTLRDNSTRATDGELRVRLMVDKPVEIATLGELPWMLWSAAAPDDSNRLMICTHGWNALQARSSLNAFISMDRGRSWHRTLNDETSRWMSETSCAFGPEGTAYVATGASKQSGITRGHRYGQMHFYRSQDGGLTWLGPSTGPFVDWTSIAVDATRGPRRGTVYLFGHAIAGENGTWDPRPRLVRTSVDFGATFSQPVFAPGKDHTLPLASVVLRDGTAMALFVDRIVKTSDGGRSLIVLPPLPDPIPLGAGLAVDQTGGRFDGRFYVVYPNVRAGRAVLMLAISDDGGQTWRSSVAARFQRRSGSDLRRAFGGVAVNRDGVVGLTWYEPGTECQRFTVSTDGGHTFDPGIALSRCAPLRLASKTPFKNHLWTMGFYESDGRESAKKPGVSIRLEPVILYGSQLAVDSEGKFHPFWMERHANGQSVLRTTGIAIQTSGKPAPESPPISLTTHGMRNLTDDIIVDITEQHYDADRDTFTIYFTLTNKSKTSILSPLRLRVAEIESGFGFGKPEILNTSNGIQSEGAILDLSPYLRGGQLEPGIPSLPVAITFHVRPTINPDLIWRRAAQVLVHPISARFEIYGTQVGPQK